MNKQEFMEALRANAGTHRTTTQRENDSHWRTHGKDADQRAREIMEADHLTTLTLSAAAQAMR